jgi:hypothetical protein
MTTLLRLPPITGEGRMMLVRLAGLAGVVTLVVGGGIAMNGEPEIAPVPIVDDIVETPQPISVKGDMTSTARLVPTISVEGPKIEGTLQEAKAEVTPVVPNTVLDVLKVHALPVKPAPDAVEVDAEVREPEVVAVTKEKPTKWVGRSIEKRHSRVKASAVAKSRTFASYCATRGSQSWIRLAGVKRYCAAKG